MPVNGIELKEGQIWKTKNYGVVTLSKSGVNSDYPWRMTSPNNGDPISSITTDGKHWEDEMPELLECIYNPGDKEEKEPMKFNPRSEPTKFAPPKPGDKIICNNGEEFICCTLGFLQENIAKFISSNKPILGYREFGYGGEWLDWDGDGCTSPTPENAYDIREVIPQSSEVTDDKKEEVKEEPRYTVEEVFYAIKEHCGKYNSPLGCEFEIKNLLKRFDEDPEYKEYLRLKAIYD